MVEEAKMYLARRSLATRRVKQARVAESSPTVRRVLMLSWEYPPRIVGGIARHVAELSAALARRGLEVHVITAHHPESPPQEVSRSQGAEVAVHRAPPDPIWPPDFVTSIQHLNFGMCERFLASNLVGEIDLIHAHDWLAAYCAKTLKHGLGRPLVATIHATEYGRNEGLHTDLQRYIHAAEWLLTFEAGRVICCSEFMAREVERVLTVPPDKVSVVNNGIEPRRVTLRPRERESLADFRARYARPEEKIVFFIGRLVREKGAQILVEAAWRVVSSYPGVKFILAGGGWAEALRNRAWALGIGDRVILPGFVNEEDLAKFYAMSDVAVFPSLYEPFGIVALEAMAAGVPVVTSDIGGLREVVRHGETGLHTWANNPDSLAWGILEVLRNPAAAQRRAEAAKREVKKHFTWDRIAGMTEEVYQEAWERWLASRSRRASGARGRR